MLSEQQKASLKRLNIDTDTTEEAKEKLLEFLATFDIDGVDNEPLDDLIKIGLEFEQEIVPTKKFVEPKTQGGATITKVSEQDLDALAAEVKTMKAREKRGTKASQESDVQEGGEVKKKKNRKNTTIVKLDPGENEEHRAKISALLAPFIGKEEFVIKYIKEGISIALKQPNAEQLLFCYRVLQERDGVINGLLYLNRFKDAEEFLNDICPPGLLSQSDIYQYKKHSCLNLVSVVYETVLKLISDPESKFLARSISSVKTSDKRLAANRKNIDRILAEGELVD